MTEQPYEFVIVIPVADRPKQLYRCLDSLRKQIERFGYPRISVLVAEDSLSPQACIAHQSMVEHFASIGYNATYLGHEEQQSLSLEFPSFSAEGGHKGASRTRNLCLIWLHQYMHGRSDVLAHFIDSDQEFRVRIGSGIRAREPMPFSFYGELNELFADQRIQVLTGKVVGDPPVSPAVMASGMLDDCLAFLDVLGQKDPERKCAFHHNLPEPGQVAYHDMAELFGFQRANGFEYPCPIVDRHNNAECLGHFCQSLDAFFDGLQPFRSTAYEATDPAASLRPARTLYTGNYVLRPSALRWFIPFAELGLRMAGPTLGRLLQQEMGDGFRSVNLPMLHKRTLEDSGKAEFRSGIRSANGRRDIHLEFEQQFFGDVMLFSMEKLIASGYPEKHPSIREPLEQTLAEMQQRYRLQHDEINHKLAELKLKDQDQKNWWAGNADMGRFISDMEFNFGDQAQGYQLINDPMHCASRLQQMTQALEAYGEQMAAWQSYLDRT